MTRTHRVAMVAVSALLWVGVETIMAQTPDTERQAELQASQTALRATPYLSGLDPKAVDAALSGKGIRQVVSPQAAANAPNTPTPSFFMGMTRTACEAMLCLSAIGEAPGECAEALAEYHAMQMFGMGNTFLLMCPTQ
jgi:threonine/homoserine/homoserine lactone efflux protein